MKKRRLCKLFSLLLAGIVTVTSVDFTVLAKNRYDQPAVVVEASQGSFLQEKEINDELLMEEIGENPGAGEEETEEGRPEEGKTEEDKPEEGENEEGKTEEGETEEGKTEEDQPEEGKPEEDQTEEGKTEEGKTEEGDQTEEDQTEEGKNEEGNTQEGETEEGKTEEDKPEEGKTEEDQTEEGKTEEGETEEDKTEDDQTQESFYWGDITEEDRLLYATEEFPFGDVSKVPEGMWLAGIKEEGYVYSGEQIIFDSKTNTELRVYDGKKLLKPERDYTTVYKNNINAYQLTESDTGFNSKKAPTVILNGKGNYSGNITKTFTIYPLDLSTLNEEGIPLFQTEDITLSYNGKVQKGTPKVTYTNTFGKKVALKVKRDFTYDYPGTNTTDADYHPSAFKEVRDTPYTGLIVGCGNYTGILKFQESITASILISKAKALPVKAREYTGEEIRPEVTLQYQGEILKEYDEESQSGDYTLTYENNLQVGTATILIQGKGKFAGSRTLTFKIQGIDLKKAKIEGFQTSCIYTGDEVIQDKVQISFHGKGTLVTARENEHYIVEYTNNESIGTATAIYRGIEKNGWSGTIKKKFKISPYDINSDNENRISVTGEEGQKYPQYFPYVKGGVKPKPQIKYTSPTGKEYLLTEGVDYKLSYKKNKNLYEGTQENEMATIVITGKGNFKGKRQKEKFGIQPAEIGQLFLTAKDKVYQNKKGQYKTTVTITDTDGKKLKAGTDYEKEMIYYYAQDVLADDGTQHFYGEEVGLKDIVPVDTMLMVEIRGKGKYKGTAYAQYRIVGMDLSKAVVRVSRQYYTGEEVCPDKSQIVILLNGKVLHDEDYEILSYANNREKGKATLTVAGTGKYGGRKTVNFTIANKSMFYMISFQPNGATSGNMKDLRLWYQKSYSLTKNTYKRTGYQFRGWNTRADGSGTDAEGKVILYPDKATDPIKIGKEDMGKTLFLYAQWEMATYKITYQLNGGTNAEENPDSYTIKDEIILKDPTRKGYAFLGWYKDSKFTESQKISKISPGTAGNLVLHAKWKETFVGEVEMPQEGTYINVMDFGAYPDDNKDDTSRIEAAVKQASENYTRAKNALEEEYGEAAKNMEVEAINTVYVPAGTYLITAGHAYNEGEPGICMKSNVNLIMDSKAVLKVASSSYEDYCVISIKNSQNIKIQGGTMKGERYRHQGSGGEDGHGVAIYGGKNIEISNMSISSNWGDGIYLGTQAVRQSDGSQKYVGCDKIVIKNCDIFDNRRSNISVTDADNLTIDHCYIYDAHGTSPQCGICIEPNSNSSGDRICRKIVLKDTKINAYQNRNSPDYMCFMTHYNPYVSGYTTAEDIWFENCVFNGYVGNYSGNNLRYDEKTKFNGEFDNHR